MVDLRLRCLITSLKRSQLGYGVESVRSWVKQADIDDGHVAGVSTDETRRVEELEQENRELRRANDMAESTGGRNELRVGL